MLDSSSAFQCVTCGKSALLQQGDRLVCPRCGMLYPIEAQVPIILPSDKSSLVAAVDGREVLLEAIQRVYNRAYKQDGLMGTDLDKEYDRATKSTLLGFAGLLSNKRLLDVGAGIGSLWDYMPCGVEGYALDVSSVGMAKAMQRHPGLTVSVSVAEYIPYPDGYFDVVVAADTIEHTLSPERSLAEIHRVLKAGGVFCASFPVRDSLRKWGLNRLLRCPQPGLFPRLALVLLKRLLLFGSTTFQLIDRDREASDWASLLERAGFSLAKTLEWPGPPQIPIVSLFHTTKE